jgi:hypothetical protein
MTGKAAPRSATIRAVRVARRAVTTEEDTARAQARADHWLSSRHHLLSAGVLVATVYWINLLGADGDTVELSLHSYVPELIFVQHVNHPLSLVHATSAVFCGRVKTLRHVQIDPPAAFKRKF